MNTSYFTLIATQAALKAGEVISKGFNTAYNITSKEGMQNLVTEYDKKSEEVIITLLQSHFSDHSFLAEESGETLISGSKITWVIDPLDGTVNFAHNIPIFSVSIAACLGEQILCGVVFQPMTQELFVAEKNKGAYLNGTRLSVTKRTSLEGALLATGFPYNVNENPGGCIDVFAKLTKIGYPIRRLGSAAIDLSYVAAGRFDAYWEVSLKPWDMAAGKLLVQEAGGKISHYDGSERAVFSDKNLLASNGLIHPLMIQHLTV